MSCSVNMEAENDYQLAAQTDIVTFLLKKMNVSGTFMAPFYSNCALTVFYCKCFE